MRKKIALLLSVVLIFILVGCGRIPENPASDFKYEDYRDGIKITSYIGKTTKLKIPTEIDGKPVTSITTLLLDYGTEEYKIREGATDFTEAILQDGITEIGEMAFAFTALETVTVPDSVTTIGEGAFFFCSSLSGITIPDSVTAIDIMAFGECSSLTEVTIPDSVTTIGEGAFYKCTSLTAVVIPDTVTAIEEMTFLDCTSLTNAAYKGKSYSYDNINELYEAINS